MSPRKGFRPIEDVKTVLGPCLGVTGSITGFVVPKKLAKYPIRLLGTGYSATHPIRLLAIRLLDPILGKKTPVFTVFIDTCIQKPSQKH